MNKTFNPVRVAFAALLIMTPAFAEITLTPALSVDGYAAASYTKTEKRENTDFYIPGRYDLDCAKLGFTFKYAPVKTYVSLYYNSEDTDVLEAYADVDIGKGFTLTGGRFLSYLGFEAFDAPLMYQISYANGDFLAPIPVFHSGVKLTYASDVFSVGAAFLDSVYADGRALGLTGDGEVKNNAGIEAFVSVTPAKGLTFFLGVGHETKYRDSGIVISPSITVVDFWVSYEVTEKLMFAGEYANKQTSDGGDKGYNWLVLGKAGFTDKIGLVARVSGEKIKDGPGFTKCTLSPSYTVNENFSILAEASIYKYKDYVVKDDAFFSVQAIFTF